MTCKPFDVVIVPFPFTERRASKRRPALALSSQAFSEESGYTVLAMITSADNPPWPMDVPIYAASAGLKSHSKVGMKLFTLDNRLILRKSGSLSAKDRRSIKAVIEKLLGV